MYLTVSRLSASLLFTSRARTASRIMCLYGNVTHTVIPVSRREIYHRHAGMGNSVRHMVSKKKTRPGSLADRNRINDTEEGFVWIFYFTSLRYYKKRTKGQKLYIKIPVKHVMFLVNQIIKIKIIGAHTNTHVQ